MSHEKLTWQDRVVEYPRTFTITENPDGSITLTPAPGTVVQAGTPVNASTMNRLEQGVFDAYWQLSPLDDAETTLVRSNGQLVRIDESIGGVLRRRTELTRSGLLLASVTTTVYADDGTTVVRQWTDSLVRTGGQLSGVERTVLV